MHMLLNQIQFIMMWCKHKLRLAIRTRLRTIKIWLEFSEFFWFKWSKQKKNFSIFQDWLRWATTQKSDLLDGWKIPQLHNLKILCMKHSKRVDDRILKETRNIHVLDAISESTSLNFIWHFSHLFFALFVSSLNLPCSIWWSLSPYVKCFDCFFILLFVTLSPLRSCSSAPPFICFRCWQCFTWTLIH